MIFDGKQLLYRAWVLSARNAARRFMRGGSSAAARTRSWTPLVLRWRKRRAIKQGMPAGSFVSSTNVASFPQFHFYFTQFFAQRGRGAGSSKTGLPLSIPDAQTIRSYKSLDLVRATPRLSGAAGYRRRRPAGHRIEERVNPKAGMQSESRYSAQNDAPGIVRSFLSRESTLFYRPGAGRKRLPPNAGETRTAMPARALPTLVFAGRSRSGSDRRPMPAARTRAETSNAALSAREATFRPALSYQGEELVWRRVTRSLADHEERSHRRTSADRPVRAEPSPAEVSRIAGDLSSSAAASADRAITSFDPAMVDRLTDDIIRRVEKRARIERERRGIG
jgi:hypothetical protein